jgi:hypothetical protein
MSKGSAPRPFSVSQEEYNSRWDAIFGRDLDDKPDKKDLPRSPESPRNDASGSEVLPDGT